MEYHDFITTIRQLGFRYYHFKDYITFRHFKNGFELDVPREDFPKKNVTPEQCQAVYDELMELLKIHNKQVNYRFNW